MLSTPKQRLVLAAAGLLSLSLLVFIPSGYAALYWAWPRHDLASALPYLPWARASGAFVVAGAFFLLGVLFSAKTFPLSPKAHLWLSLLIAAAIALFAEFRNDGKFYFKGLHHFFRPGTWMQETLSRVAPSFADFLYRVEYSHWNDFLLGPAVVSVLFPFVFASLHRTIVDTAPVGLRTPEPTGPEEREHAVRFARIFLNVGLFWFFLGAWGEKAGYLANPHSADQIDLPVEFAGTALGFWMVRVLTKLPGERSEEFRSTFLIDFVSAGAIGLLYTLLVGPLTQGLASAVAHALVATVPPELESIEVTPFERHLRPFELLLLALMSRWIINHVFKPAERRGLLR